MRPLELWAGPECTVNRVGDDYRDQLVSSGFDARLDDLDRLASLGITAMRFPLLWERTAPLGPGLYDWHWTDTRLARLRGLGVAPIAGLLHHGSGPSYTNLLDPLFPARLAHYAGAAARRYPWIAAYTPVNEPVTTARFSGLYGLWYPHGRDDASFVRALLNQMRATVMSMQAIRAVNPSAQLVQTDDLGHTSSVPRLQYQARFENLRRWLSFDLLAGKVTRRHRLWPYLRKYGATEAELRTFEDAPCPPDIVGINCYVTSERFLDDRIALYPPRLRGGNRRDSYADVEAARVHGVPIGGFDARLREAAERYGLPLAITEVHLGCTREEQLRWLHQAWSAARLLCAEGLDIRAVTAWAAFGTFDWNSLLTVNAGHYEPGLWDVSVAPPRPTALATLASQLVRGIEPDNPVVVGPGWWQRKVRLSYPHHGELASRPMAGRPLVITGASGTLGRACARLCQMRGLPYHLLARQDMDIADPASVESALRRLQPWAVINTAGYVRVDDAENEERHWRENVSGPTVLAIACQRHGVRLMGFSSDLVFDGGQDVPYVEQDTPRPLNAYGRGKVEAERRILEGNPGALVIRTAAFFGPWDSHNFVTQALAALGSDAVWHAANDQCVSPTYVPDLVNAALDLLIDGEGGIWHLANRGAVTWSGFAQMAAEAANLQTGRVRGVPGALLGQTAPRPRFSALGSERGVLMPTLANALERYLAERALLAAGDGGPLESVGSRQDEAIAA